MLVVLTRRGISFDSRFSCSLQASDSWFVFPKLHKHFLLIISLHLSICVLTSVFAFADPFDCLFSSISTMHLDAKNMLMK
jgi:hypothetical protein